MQTVLLLALLFSVALAQTYCCLTLPAPSSGRRRLDKKGGERASKLQLCQREIQVSPLRCDLVTSYDRQQAKLVAGGSMLLAVALFFDMWAPIAQLGLLVGAHWLEYRNNQFAGLHKTVRAHTYTVYNGAR